MRNVTDFQRTFLKNGGWLVNFNPYYDNTLTLSYTRETSVNTICQLSYILRYGNHRDKQTLNLCFKEHMFLKDSVILEFVEINIQNVNIVNDILNNTIDYLTHQSIWIL
jgi:hypothetical protein